VVGGRLLKPNDGENITVKARGRKESFWTGRKNLDRLFSLKEKHGKCREKAPILDGGKRRLVYRWSFIANSEKKNKKCSGGLAGEIGRNGTKDVEADFHGR